MRTFIFFLVAVFSFLTIHAEEFTSDRASWIKECQENRVYIKDDSLVIANGGIYVLDEADCPIPIPELFCDSHGIYTRAESIGTALMTVWNIVWCRTCRAYRSVDINGRCVVCGNIP